RILAWADAHFARTGRWPIAKSGEVYDAPGETWQGISLALARGTRGLSGGSTLAQLLDEWRGVRNRKGLSDLSHPLVLAWCDAHFARTGEWPTGESGPVRGVPRLTWHGVEQSLRQGLAGLEAGCTLADFLLAHRRGPRYQAVPTVAQILTYADAHFRRT